MSLQEILNHRRAVRHFDPAKPIDETTVKKCIELASLAPTSSNLQLWEAYHVTDKQVLEQLVPENGPFGTANRSVCDSSRPV